MAPRQRQQATEQEHSNMRPSFQRTHRSPSETRYHHCRWRPVGSWPTTRSAQSESTQKSIEHVRRFPPGPVKSEQRHAGDGMNREREGGHDAEIAPTSAPDWPSTGRRCCGGCIGAGIRRRSPSPATRCCRTSCRRPARTRRFLPRAPVRRCLRSGTTHLEGGDLRTPIGCRRRRAARPLRQWPTASPTRPRRCSREETSMTSPALDE